MGSYPLRNRTQFHTNVLFGSCSIRISSPGNKWNICESTVPIVFFIRNWIPFSLCLCLALSLCLGRIRLGASFKIFTARLGLSDRISQIHFQKITFMVSRAFCPSLFLSVSVCLYLSTDNVNVITVFLSFSVPFALSLSLSLALFLCLSVSLALSLSLALYLSVWEKY